MQKKKKTILNSVRIGEKEGLNINNNIPIKNSMLLNIQNFGDPTQLFCSKMIFNDNYINFYEEKLLEKNWKEICYIYEDYDLYDIYYELQAVGLPENTFYSKCTFGFTLEGLNEIIEFEI